MPRLHTLYLPGDGEGMPFAFILDQTNPMTEEAMAAWDAFAVNCGALDIMLTADTIDIDPEISDSWEPDDEPIGYTPAGEPGIRVVGLPDLMRLAQAANAAAWEEWTPANLDPESPSVMTHRKEVCPAFNDGITGCPTHDPILEGGWVTWPYYASRTAEAGGVITRICVHGVTHPTPEEYLSGFDTPHLCDGCPCAPTADFSIVVSDLANTRLPRGTLLLGVKDDPTPVTAPPSPQYHSAPATGLVPVRVPDLKPCTGRMLVNEASEACALGHGHRGRHAAISDGRLIGTGFVGTCVAVPVGDGPIAFVAEDEPITHTAMPEKIAQAPLSGYWARIQPLGADGEPVGEAGVYDLPGPVRVTKLAAEQGEPVERWTTAEIELTHLKPCGAAGDRGPCIRYSGHEGLHDFGPFTRI